MTGLSNQRVTLAQGDGSEVELVVTGTALYATYETLDGYPAVYDDDLESFCFALVVDGRYATTGIPVSAPPPPDAQRHAKESDVVRADRIAARQSHLERESRTYEEGGSQ